MEYYKKCRLCLEESDRYVDIFNETFPEMIQLLSGIKVDPTDGLPTTSCLQCHQEVKSAMLTRYQIINSNKILLEELKNGDSSTFVVSDNYSENSNKIETSEFVCNENTLVSKAEDSLDDCFREHFDLDVKPTYDSDSESKESTTKVDVNVPKKESVQEVSRRKHLKKDPNKEIKFRKKQNKKSDLKDKIDFKKKKLDNNSKSSASSAKVQYDIKPEYQEFLKTVGRKDRVACPDCGREMFGMNMKNHLITHNYDPVICDICGKTSKNAQALQDHINYYHKTTPDRFMCDKCGKGYRVRFMLERHEKKEHGNGERDYECSICGKKFFEKLHLKTHINITHNKVKPYKCEHCGKGFGRRTQFVTHQLVHTKENRYHCQVCGKGFKIKQTMQTHLKGVHGIEEEKTIFCNICNKGFSSPHGLRAHINSRVHGLEKCEHCSEFITVEYKSVHLRDIHGICAETAYS